MLSTAGRWDKRIFAETGHADLTVTLEVAGCRCQLHSRTTFKDDDASLATAVKQWLLKAEPEFYCEGIQALLPGWRKAVQREEDYV
jgi:hypothetical protein